MTFSHNPEHKLQTLDEEDLLNRIVAGVETIKDYAILIMDTNGIVLNWNMGASLLTGYSADEMVGRHFSVFYQEDALRIGHPDYALKMARESGRFEEEGWRVRKNGETFWANVIISAIHDSDGTFLGFSNISRDLTERKRLEDQLKKAKEDAETAEERYRMLITGVRDYAIFMLDPKGIVMSWNLGAQRIKGYEAEEIIGQHFSKFYPTEDIEAGKCEFELKYAALEGVFEDEGFRLRKDGSKFWANVVITAMFNEHNQLIGYSKITRDITERKDMESALRESEKRYRQMAEKVIERSREFESISNQLQYANKELESFSYSVSHDLRAPLRSIVGFSEILKNKKSDQLDDEAKGYLDRVCQNTRRMDSLINDMLKLCKINQTPIRRETVDLSALALEAISEFQEQEPERQVRIQIPPDITADGDVGLLRIVVQNLLHNAWKYSRDRFPALVEIGRFQKGDQTVYFVKDNGVGFNMTYHKKMFDVFQRIHSSQDFPGNGIGLATVQRIIHRHGGKIWAESVEDEGATFYFTLD